MSMNKENEVGKLSRRSMRLRDYDYSSTGAYFVTVCLNGNRCLLGRIVDGKMQINDAGEMIVKWWHELNNKYSLVETDEFVVMPNHIHGIIIINDSSTVGAALCGSPNGRPRRGAPTLGDILGWFKTMTTNEYIRCVKQLGWEPFFFKIWQRNYYEHVIRNENDLHEIREYIINNPLKWELDKEPQNFIKGANTMHSVQRTRAEH